MKARQASLTDERKKKQKEQKHYKNYYRNLKIKKKLMNK